MTASHRKAGEKNTVRRHTPLRRAVKIVGPWRVSLSLVCGVGLTVLVAWWIALEPGVLPNPSFAHHHEDSSPPVVYWRSSATEPLEVTVWSPRGGQIWALTAVYDEAQFEDLTMEDWWDAEERADRPAWVQGLRNEAVVREGLSEPSLTEIVSGWPFGAMVNRLVHTPTGDRHIDSWPLPASWVRSLDIQKWPYAPVVPLFPGFLLDASVFGSALYLGLSTPCLVSGLRRRLGKRCHPCGYRLDGLTGDTCPECGWVIKRKTEG